jgi:hypothetical protein
MIVLLFILSTKHRLVRTDVKPNVRLAHPRIRAHLPAMVGVAPVEPVVPTV